jgi:hypothetical protein
MQSREQPFSHDGKHIQHVPVQCSKEPSLFHLLECFVNQEMGHPSKRSHTDVALSSVKTTGLQKTKQNRNYSDFRNYKMEEGEK